MPNISRAYVRLAIFDADGVVTSSKKFAVDLEKKFGIKPEALTPFFEGPFQEALIGKADLKVIIEPYLKEWGWTGSIDSFLEFWFHSENAVNNLLAKKIMELREQGIKCYLATNQEKYRKDYMREEMNLKQLVNGIFSSSDLGCKKPDKQFFERLLKRLDPKREIPTKEILFWDDSEENVAAAKAFGIQAYQYTDELAFVEKMQEVPIMAQRFLKARTTKRKR